MKKIILIVSLIWSGFVYSQNLTPEQQIKFIKQRLDVNLFRKTQTSFYTGKYYGGGSSVTVDKWNVSKNNLLLNESTFYKIVGDDEYYKRAKSKEELASSFDLVAWGTFIGGFAVIGIPFLSSLQSKSNFFSYENEAFFPLFITSVGLSLLVAPIFGLISLELNSTPITSYQTAKSFADIYNNALLIKIKKNF